MRLVLGAVIVAVLTLGCSTSVAIDPGVLRADLPMPPGLTATAVSPSDVPVGTITREAAIDAARTPSARGVPVVRLLHVAGLQSPGDGDNRQPPADQPVWVVVWPEVDQALSQPAGAAPRDPTVQRAYAFVDTSGNVISGLVVSYLAGDPAPPALPGP